MSDRAAFSSGLVLGSLLFSSFAGETAPFGPVALITSAGATFSDGDWPVTLSPAPSGPMRGSSEHEKYLEDVWGKTWSSDRVW